MERALETIAAEEPVVSEEETERRGQAVDAMRAFGEKQHLALGASGLKTSSTRADADVGFYEWRPPFTVRVLESLKDDTCRHAGPVAVRGDDTIDKGRAPGRINAAQQAEFLERLRQLPTHIEHRPSAWRG